MKTKYRFFRHDFCDESGCLTFEIEIFKIGRKDGFVTTGSIHSLRKQQDRANAGWYCLGTLKEMRKSMPGMREIQQSTARKLLRRCPVRFYENLVQGHPCVSRDEFISILKNRFKK
jgi:hypothetical protein